MLVGGDALFEEQTPLALDQRPAEGDRLARWCHGLPLVPGAGAGVGMQGVHRLGDGVTPAIVDDVLLVVVGVDCVGGISGLLVVVICVVLLLVGCDILSAVD